MATPKNVIPAKTEISNQFRYIPHQPLISRCVCDARLSLYYPT